MHFLSQTQRRSGVPLLPMAGCAVALALLLVSCGWQSTSSTKTGGSSSTPVATASVANSQTPGAVSTPNPLGCPSNTTVSASPPADVVADVTHRQDPVEAQVGNVIELRLAFGQRWSGPQNAPAGLELQTPGGYADQADKACVWRFVARQAGTFNLDFEARALCKQGEMCAMYIIDNPVTIAVKG